MEKKRRKKNNLKPNTEKVNILEISNNDTYIEENGFSYSKHTFFKEYGLGHCSLYAFDGLYITLFDVDFKKEIIVEGTFEDSILELSYLLEGDQIIDINGINRTFIYENQESYLVYLPNQISGAVRYGHKKMKEVKIRMDSHFLKKHHLTHAIDRLNINQISEKNFINPITSEKHEILASFFKDRFEGTAQRLFLESQTLNLLSIQLKEKSSQSKPNNTLKKIYQTQQLISEDLSQHYSIKELSKIIGLNDFILKKEFKKVFDKSIFEYLTDLRMNKSIELLEHSNQPIYEIAETVGYKNATHFSAAFKRSKNLTPKAYRIQQSG